MKRVLVLGGGGFIGGHLGNYVRVVDIKNHDYFDEKDFCDEFILGDLRDPKVVSESIDEGMDEVYQLAADMGGAGYIFTGENDANVMHNSALINLNVVHECTKKNVKKVFYSSCILNTINLTPITQIVKNLLHIQQIPILNTVGKNYSLKDYF